jgi:hypothetical protein
VGRASTTRVLNLAPITYDKPATSQSFFPV